VLRRAVPRPDGAVAAGAEPGAAADPEEAAAEVNDAFGLARNYRELRKQRGADSIDASKRLGELKEGKLELVEEFLGGRVNRDRRLVERVAGRAFYLSGDRWVDAALGERSLDGARVIEYLSDAYFELLRQHPGIGRILALGSEIAFLWEGEVLLVRGGSS
jgi:hypothetical protein